MLRITIELLPGGRESAKRVIATAKVSNLPYLADISDYAVDVETAACTEPWLRPWESRGMIAGHDRQQTVWALVAKVAAWAVREAEKH